MKKILVISILLLVMLFSVNVYAENEITVVIDNERIEFDVQPQIVNGRTLVPVRSIFETLGFEVSWNGETQTVLGKSDDLEIELQISNKTSKVNNNEVLLDVPAQIIDGRTLVPVRFIAESTGAKVQWISETKTVDITSKEKRYSSTINAVFLSEEETKEKINKKDDFISAMSQFDKNARMKSESNVTDEEFLEFLGESAREFSSKEKSKINKAISSINARIKDYKLMLPSEIGFAKTSGIEEGGASYTRNGIVYISEQIIKKDLDTLEEIIIKDIFYIYIEENNDIKEKLFETVFFIHCNELEFPDDLAELKITNPDSINNDYYILIDHDGEEVKAIPIIYAVENYSKNRGGEFFDYLESRVIVVEEVEGKVIPKYIENNYILLVNGAMYQKLKMSSFKLSPADMVANNFLFLIMGEDIENNIGIELEQIEKIKQVLKDNML